MTNLTEGQQAICSCLGVLIKIILWSIVIVTFLNTKDILYNQDVIIYEMQTREN